MAKDNTVEPNTFLKPYERDFLRWVYNMGGFFPHDDFDEMGSFGTRYESNRGLNV